MASRQISKIELQSNTADPSSSVASVRVEALVTTTDGFSLVKAYEFSRDNFTPQETTFLDDFVTKLTTHMMNSSSLIP